MLTQKDFERFDRQIRLIGAEGQEKLKNAKVLIVGVGGLGTSVATYLAYAGVGKLILIDDGLVELSNLNRQILYTESDIGKPKVLVACERIRSINSNIELECYNRKFDYEFGEKLVNKADVVVDALDNWSTRLILNELCVRYRKPLIHAGVEGWYGQVTTIIPGKTPCLFCLRPLNVRGVVKEDRVIPVMGVTPGLLGVLEASEAIKLILNTGKVLENKLLIVDLLNMEFTLIEVRRNPRCPVCGMLSSEKV